MNEKINKINGNIYFTKTLSDGKEINLQETNALTDVCENAILASTIGAWLSSNMGSEAGVARVNIPQRYTSTDYWAMNSESAVNCFVLYLLNLTQEELDSLSKNIKKLPFINSDGSIDYTKVVGYARFNYVGGASNEGTLTTQTPIYTINDKQYGVSFVWTAGKLNGTINCVMLGTNVMADNIFSSITMSKGLDFNNPAINELPADGHFLTNNVSLPDGTVITGPNEILLGDGSNATLARRVLNLLTGENRKLSQDDPRYGCYLFATPHTYIGEGRILVDNENNISAMTYNGSSATLIRNVYSNYARGFAIKDNIIYILDGYSYSQMKIRKYDIETLNELSPSISLTFPSFFGSGTTIEYYAITNYFDKFLFTYYGNGFNTNAAYKKSIVFSNIEDPFNSLEEGYNGQKGTNITLKDEDEDITTYLYLTPHQITNFKGLSNSYDMVYNPSSQTTNVYRNGIKYIADGYNGQVLTYSKLTTPITMTENDNLKIDYMFNF